MNLGDPERAMGDPERAMGERQVLSAESARAMRTDQLTNAQKARGGLGPDFFAGRSWGFCQAAYAALA